MPTQTSSPTAPAQCEFSFSCPAASTEGESMSKPEKSRDSSRLLGVGMSHVVARVNILHSQLWTRGGWERIVYAFCHGVNVWELHLPSPNCSGELRSSDPGLFTSHNPWKSWNIVDQEGLFSPGMKESSVAAGWEAEQSLWFCHCWAVPAATAGSGCQPGKAGLK